MGGRDGARVSACRGCRILPESRSRHKVCYLCLIDSLDLLTTPDSDPPSNCRFEYGDANQGFARFRGTFDVINVRCVATTGILDLGAFLEEMHEILRPGGVFLYLDDFAPTVGSLVCVNEAEGVDLSCYNSNFVLLQHHIKFKFFVSTFRLNLRFTRGLLWIVRR